MAREKGDWYVYPLPQPLDADILDAAEPFPDDASVLYYGNGVGIWITTKKRPVCTDVIHDMGIVTARNVTWSVSLRKNRIAAESVAV